MNLIYLQKQKKNCFHFVNIIKYNYILYIISVIIYFYLYLLKRNS